MKLSEWLPRRNLSRVEFARRIGVTPGAVTQLCNSDHAWMSRGTATLIAQETRGAVTPNDFLPAASRGAAMPNPVNEAIDAFARGEIVIVTDDDDRENEGDLIVAASLCTPEKMAFIMRNTCGIVCVPLTAADARRLRLDPMVASNDAPLGTAFTVSVDVAPRADHRHLRRAALQHRAGARQRQHGRRRFRAPRPRLPARSPRTAAF